MNSLFEKGITLLQLLQDIEHATNQRYPKALWIKAEIASLRWHNPSGHAYLELVQTDEAGSIIARINANIWKSSWDTIRTQFKQATSEELQAGMKVLILGKPTYRPIYGLSINIQDVDPAYTAGQFVLQREQTIARLIEQNIYDLNKNLPRSTLPRNIAVVSSPQAAGFQDFTRHLQRALSLYPISITLFEATMQGQAAVNSITSALNLIEHVPPKGAYTPDQMPLWDRVVIIRGGGASVDLSVFNHFDIAQRVATLPYPVLTGIGHDKDFTATDAVAHEHFKTPTAAAEAIITDWTNAHRRLTNAQTLIKRAINQNLEVSTHKLSLSTERLKSAVRLRMQSREKPLILNMKSIATASHLAMHRSSSRLNTTSSSLKNQIIRTLDQKTHRFESACQIWEAANPMQVLKKGYAIIHTPTGRITSYTQAIHSNPITITFHDGDITLNTSTQQ